MTGFVIGVLVGGGVGVLFMALFIGGSDRHGK